MQESIRSSNMKLFLPLFFIIVHAAAVVQPSKGEVACANGTVQLVEGPNEFEGRVEFCANGSWAQVCGGGTWGRIPASLVCSGIEKSFNSNVTSDYYGMDNLRLNFVNIHQAVCKPYGKFGDCVTEIHNRGCNGLLASVACPVNCEAGSIRLISESQNLSTGGLVEICLKAGNLSYWTGVCHENFTLAAAMVVCRQQGLLRSDLLVTISNSSTRHWRTYTYNAFSCIGYELRISECQHREYKEEARCSSVIVNCQGGSPVDNTTFPEGATGSEFSSTSIATEPTLVDRFGSNMLIIITGTICGFAIVLLLIAMILLALILITKSRTRNSSRRLKGAAPTMVDGLQQQSNTAAADSRNPTSVRYHISTSSEQLPSQIGSLKTLTINNTSTTLYTELRDIQTVRLPTPADSHGYPANNCKLQRDSGIMFPQSDTVLPLDQQADHPDVHIYAEPSKPGLNSRGHVYAELESARGDGYQNSTTLAAPLPYETPVAIGGSYVNVTVPEPSPHSTCSTKIEDDWPYSVHHQNMISLISDHQYAVPGHPS